MILDDLSATSWMFPVRHGIMLVDQNGNVNQSQDLVFANMRL